MIEPRTVPVEFKVIGVVNPLIVEIDRDIVNIVKAINKFPGIRTVESCSGHGNQKASIFFVPETIDALPALLYYFDWCHSGVYWPVYITTDCSAARVTWVVESEEVGPIAYIEGNSIAEAMLNDDLFKCGDD